jgi:hypothetical protein
MDLKGMGGCGIISSVSKHGLAAGFCEKESSSSIKGGKYPILCGSQILKNDSAPWSTSHQV